MDEWTDKGTRTLVAQKFYVTCQSTVVPLPPKNETLNVNSHLPLAGSVTLLEEVLEV